MPPDSGPSPGAGSGRAARRTRPQVEDDDALAAGLHHLAAAGRDLRHGRDDMPRHQSRRGDAHCRRDRRALRLRDDRRGWPRADRRNPSADSRTRTGSGPSRSSPSVSSRCSGRSGSSIGWVETQMCSRMYSDGARFRCGTSSRSRFQVLVEPPGERGHPGEAAFDQQHAQLREALEDALDDHGTAHLRLAGGRVFLHFLDIEGRPAAIRHGSPNSRRRGCRPAGPHSAAACQIGQ
jgi:hypothetical protein